MNYTLNIKKNNKNSLCILLNGKKYEVNSQWLYEHSDNEEIRDPYTKQLLIEAAEISPSLKIIDAQIEKETLAITFSDNSQHNYKINYIYSQLKKAPVSDDKYLWNKKNLKVPKYNFKNINNKMLFDIMSSVDKLGFCLVRNIPKKKNGLNELMKLIGPVKKTNWGGIADVKNINKAYDLTMTTRGLENHTDNPYRFPTQGYIFLHCIENANNGGENTITDGFNIANILRKRHKKYFDTLTSFNTFFRYADKNAYLENKCKLIELDDDNNICQIRYNNRTEVMPYENNKRLNEYIKARRKFWDLIKDSKNNIEIKQMSGDMLILDNYRVLHGRKSYKDRENKRYFRQGYMDRDIFQSKLKTATSS